MAVPLLKPSDRRAYEMCRLAFIKYRRAPDLVRAHARKQIAAWRREKTCSPWYWRRWNELLLRPIAECERIVMASTDEGQVLRANNPFPGLFSRAERTQILEAGRREEARS